MNQKYHFLGSALQTMSCLVYLLLLLLLLLRYALLCLGYVVLHGSNTCACLAYLACLCPF